MSEWLSDPWFLAQSSLKYFTRKFLRFAWPVHYEEWTRMLMRGDRLLIQAPRGHGKSVFFSLAYPLWRVINGKTEILLVSYSEDQVRRLIREIRVAIESVAFLSPLRPTTKEVWGTDQLSFANGSYISGLGFGTSSRGRHPDVIIVDDPLKDLGGMTDEDQERAYFGVITGMAMDKTKIVTVGTPVNYNDLLEKLEKNPTYLQWKRPAFNEDGSALFPELKSREFLENARREMGSINFAREYLLERVDPATQPFKKEYETLYDIAPPRERCASVVTVCDPAYSEKDGDATAIVTIGFTHGNHAYVLQAKEVRKENPGEVVDELFKTINTYRPDAVGIERRKGESVSYSFNERRTRDNEWGFRYVELSHGGLSKGARASMVGGLIPRWEARAVHVQRNDTRFLQQLYQFRFNDETKGHDDLVDAASFCFHPDMTKPNAGKRSVPERSGSVGKPFFRVGVINTVSAPPKNEPLWKRLDRRVYDQVAA